MTTFTYQKTVNAAYLISIASVIIIPDVVSGLLLELLHSLLELAHLLFELFESTLDHIVEHIFHTGRHETQVIVFYLMLSMAFGGLYYLWRRMPRIYRKLKENLFAAIRQRKLRLARYWTGQPLINKIKLIAMFNVGLTCFILFGF
jgi:hypothetical protein